MRRGERILGALGVAFLLWWLLFFALIARVANLPGGVTR